MTTEQILQNRLSNQQLYHTQFKTPYEIVKHFGAIQAQEYEQAKFSIGLRLKSIFENDVEKDIVSKKIARTWPMRGTLHFIPAEDTKWMVKLLAARVNKRLNSYYKKVELNEKVFNKSRDLIAKALQGGKSLTRPELYKILENSKIATKDMRGLFILGHLAQEGTLCFGMRNQRQHTFVLLDEWITNSKKLEGEEALAEIALRYFRSHGPATIYDFVGWTGLSVTGARQAINVIKDKLVEEKVGERSLWMVPVHKKLMEKPSAYLLPAYDEYTVAYKDRSDLIEQSAIKILKTSNGFWSSMILEGKIIGTWRRTIKKNELNIQLSPIISIKKTTKEEFEEAASNYGEFFNKQVTVHWEV